MRTRRRFAARVLAALGASVVAWTLAAGSAAASVTPSPSPTVEPPSGVTAFTLAPIRNGILNPGEGLTTSVTIENGTTVATPATAVTLELGRGALSDREALTAWLAGDAGETALEAVGTGTIEPAAPGETSSAAIMVDAAALGELGPGVHPLRASYDSPAGTVRSTSVVVVPRADQPLGIGVVVPITAGPQTDAILTSTQLAELTSEGGALTKQLDGVELTTAILAIDPAITASIRALGKRAPASAVAWLARLDALDNTRFALQYGDADPAVQVEAGLTAPLAPTSFASFLTPADFTAPTPTPTPTASPTAPVSPVPTRDELLDVRAARGAVFWPAADAVTPASVATLGAISDGTQTSLTLVPSTAAGTGGARAAAGDAGVLVYDTDVSRELSSAASIDESTLRAAPLAAASAYLSFAAADGSPVLAAIDRGTDRSHIGLQTSIAAAAEYPGAVPHSLLTLSAAAPRPVTLAETAAPQERVAEAAGLFSDEAELGRFATILDDPSLLTAPERAEILQLLAVGWGATPVEASVAVGAHRESTRETLASVHLLSTPTINLLAAGAGLPFTVRNDLPYAVNLVLFTTPDDLRLGVRRATEIVATPQSNTRVEVPVRAVGNGEVTLDLQLRSPSFVAIGPPETVDVNVRAEWEAFGIAGLSILVGGLVLLGVVRTVLKARARRKSKADAAAAASDEDPS